MLVRDERGAAIPGGINSPRDRCVARADLIGAGDDVVALVIVGERNITGAGDGRNTEARVAGRRDGNNSVEREQAPIEMTLRWPMLFATKDFCAK